MNPVNDDLLADFGLKYDFGNPREPFPPNEGDTAAPRGRYDFFAARKYILLCLCTLTILFFTPWFASDMDQKVMTSFELITGLNISRYAGLLSNLNPGAFLSVVLSAAEYLYVLPLIAVISALVLLIDKMLGLVMTIISSFLHASVAISFLLLPASIGEMIRLMFVVTPTVYLYGLSGVICLALAIVCIVKETKAHSSQKRKTDKSHPKRKAEPEMQGAKKKREAKKKISVSKNRH